MRINFKTHPILKKLHDGKLGEVAVMECDIPAAESGLFYVFSDFWKRYASNFKKDVNVISKPFHLASVQVQDKLFALYGDIMNDIGDLCIEGTFIAGDYVHMIFHEMVKGRDAYRLAYFMFYKEGTPLAFYVNDYMFEGEVYGWISNKYCPKIDMDEKGMKTAMLMLYFKPLMYSMFKSYAQVETKIVNPNEKQVFQGEKHFNEMPFKITWLNSTWFTNIIRSEGFGVRGHFRMQPKKINGENTHELIYIAPFEKHGYNRRAGKDIHQNESAQP